MLWGANDGLVRVHSGWRVDFTAVDRGYISVNARLSFGSVVPHPAGILRDKSECKGNLSVYRLLAFYLLVNEV